MRMPNGGGLISALDAQVLDLDRQVLLHWVPGETRGSSLGAAVVALRTHRLGWVPG